MVDKVDRATRSRIMARVTSENTGPETSVRRALEEAGCVFEDHPKGLPGKPDFVFRDQNVAVFVHGCFWHLHECEHFRMPASNQPYWQNKLERNRDRFSKTEEDLAAQGWKPFVIWECELEEGVNRLIREVAPDYG
jgi:DNA mismatch endonuclease, patch repair protein